jgi:hypothetical protein
MLLLSQFPLQFSKHFTQSPLNRVKPGVHLRQFEVEQTAQPYEQVWQFVLFGNKVQFN